MELLDRKSKKKIFKAAKKVKRVAEKLGMCNLDISVHVNYGFAGIDFRYDKNDDFTYYSQHFNDY